MDNLDATSRNRESQGTETDDIIPSLYEVDSDSAAADAILDIPERSREQCIHRVPHHFRGDSRNQYLYEPVVLSIGPYHYGRPQFRPTEELKSEILVKFMAESVTKDATKGRDFFYKEMLENISVIRANYEGIDEYNNEELAEIILRDTCFLVNVITKKHMVSILISGRLGLANATWLFHDVWKLENQIPFWVLKHMLYLTVGKYIGDKHVIEYMKDVCLREDYTQKRLPWEDDKYEPLHLLEARQATFLKRSEAETRADEHFLTKLLSKCKKNWNSNEFYATNSQSRLKLFNYPCRSITYLQEKGIYFKPSSRSLMDVKFTSKPCYGILQLPILFVDNNTMVFFSNVVTFELLARDPVCNGMTYYVNLMKSLIQSPTDVKVLQESGILFSNLGTDEEIVKAFKEIDTHKIKVSGSSDDLRSRIEEHCNSKAKTWMSDFIHIYFRNPWTVIALLAAIFILCLTFIQTYFTIPSPK